MNILNTIKHKGETYVRLSDVEASIRDANISKAIATNDYNEFAVDRAYERNQGYQGDYQMNAPIYAIPSSAPNRHEYLNYWGNW
jgi:hypothetical protein